MFVSAASHGERPTDTFTEVSHAAEEVEAPTSFLWSQRILHRQFVSQLLGGF